MSHETHRLLVDRVVESPELKSEIVKLIEAKRSGDELDRGPCIPPISEFIEREMARLEGEHFEHSYDKPSVPVQRFDGLFRAALDEVWP